ncbi:MAG: hypothetical protein K6A44_03115 [bacterium]|nr:hypothetical protein [bacterium]
MNVQSINHSQSFKGNFSQKAVDFAKNQGHHMWTQGVSFLICSKLYPIDNFEQFWRAKILIDFGEYLSNIFIQNPNTTAKQCTNIFSALTDCTKDVIRWTSKLIDKSK